MFERIKQQKSFILQYFIFVSVVLLLFWNVIWQQVESEKTILVILLVYFIAFPITFLYTRKYALHVFLFCLAFITGFYSFYHYSVESHSILNALYFTFQLYLLITTEVFTVDGSNLLQYPFILEIARWSAALYTISTLFIAVYRMLEMSILAEIYQLVGRHYIVFGYNELSAKLIQDLRRHRKKVILINHQISAEKRAALEDDKVVVLIEEKDHLFERYEKAGLLKAENMILFHENDLDNLNELMNIRRFIQHKRRLDKKMKVVLHLYDTRSKELLKQFENGIEEKEFPFELKVINLYELFAKCLLTEHPLLTNDIPKNNHLLFVGFGLMGQGIAFEMMQEAKKLRQPIPRMTALDKNMQSVKGEWVWRLKHEKANVMMHDFDVKKMDLSSFIAQETYPVTHLFICLHEDLLDFREGIELANQFPELPIYLQMPKNSILNNWIDLGITKNRMIYSTGMAEDVLTMDVFTGW